MITATPGNPSRAVELGDFYPGGFINMIGQTFYIADADTFTRDYYRFNFVYLYYERSSKYLCYLIRDQLNNELPPAVSQPAVMRSDLGVAYSTGLGGHLRNEGENNTASSSANFAEQRENVQKTKQFFKV
jgi:hypothetical protein